MRDWAPFLIIPVLLLAGLFILLRGDDEHMDSSVVGVQGLGVWLRENDVPVQAFNRNVSPSADRLSLRILPLFDTDLKSDASKPRTRADLLEETTQRDIQLNTVLAKLADMPTVLILPKWRTGLMLTETAHRSLLIPKQQIERLLKQLGISGANVHHGKNTFFKYQAGRNEIALFNAQAIGLDSLPQNCRSQLRTSIGYLIIACRLNPDHQHETLIVTDPDLLNNHGLGVADNAEFALDWVRSVIGSNSNPVYMDFSPFLLIEERSFSEERKYYQRDTSDLARFFRIPFSVMWAALLVVLSVLYWRGAKRFGPLKFSEDANGHDKSKVAAIRAKARLLRLSGNDGHMVSDFVRAEIREMTSDTFGSDLGKTGTERLFRHLIRRNAKLGQDFKDCAEDLMEHAPQMHHGDLMRRLAQYRHLLEKLGAIHGT